MRSTLLRHALTDPRSGLPNALALRTFSERFQAVAARHGLELRILRLRFSGPDALESSVVKLRPHVREADILARTDDSELSLLIVVPAPEAADAARRRIAALVSACGSAVLRVESLEPDQSG